MTSLPLPFRARAPRVRRNRVTDIRRGVKICYVLNSGQDAADDILDQGGSALYVSKHHMTVPVEPTWLRRKDFKGDFRLHFTYLQATRQITNVSPLLISIREKLHQNDRVHVGLFTVKKFLLLGQQPFNKVYSVHSFL